MDEWENGMRAGEIAGARWRKATASDAVNDCVEVARLGENAFAVRNSRYPEGPALIYTRREWEAFVDGASKGEFNDMPV
ncbi:DUF397 domain-containing protein [Streptomyces buecherae]|uniref:DUF397 domain-containing protein n=1 Tax=Streptomyces buecherae TaxID=2763006 RepID=UPI0036C58BB1